ncbi:hypothetical protein RRG08_039414 [Elysia crispata]|uniref:Uncharacterized protein n=1 Tax=Elysia crispata TaxID=231223 RepID=A0AAE1ABA5_9GAST|nr:hypothetical protein RRG08_039414 [Elysia crispata]
MKRGEVKFMQANELSADKRKVSLISPASPATLPVQRRAPGCLREASLPLTVLVYKKSMFGVDLADQHRSYYGMGRSGLK